jgi:hypothetical protein
MLKEKRLDYKREEIRFEEKLNLTLRDENEIMKYLWLMILTRPLSLGVPTYELTISRAIRIIQAIPEEVFKI